MKIIYQDNEIIVCEKDQKTLSEDTKGGLPEQIRKELNDQKLEIYPVHRLDKQTGGLIVYALTKEASAALSEQITKGIFKKEYLTVVEGIPTEDEGILEDLLFHDIKKNKTYVVKRERKGVKKAKLKYKLISSVTSNDIESSNKSNISLLKIRLLTGRTHQIRVQFASRKMPVAGDRRYGSKSDFKLALWSYSLSFIHPSTKELLCFKSEPPKDNPWNAFLNAISETI